MRGIAMRIVVLGSSRYSETGCAIAARVAELGYAPVGALVLRTLDSGTLLRKVGQWGVSGAARYARTKLAPRRGADVSNPCLRPALTHGGVVFRSLRQVAARYDFPIAACRDPNAPSSIARLRQWSPDLMIFTGGNILRKPLLALPRSHFPSWLQRRGRSKFPLRAALGIVSSSICIFGLRLLDPLSPESGSFHHQQIYFGGTSCAPLCDASSFF